MSESEGLAFGLKPREFRAVVGVLSKHPEVRRALIYGSRARRDHLATSDIDIAVEPADAGAKPNLRGALMEDFSELDIILKVDVVDLAQLPDDSFKAAVLAEGVEIYPLQRSE